MTPTELVRLAGTPSWTIGGHTESHVWLPTQPNPAKSSEVFDCKHRLDLLLGSPVTSFAYPYGGHDQETVEIVRQAGFEEAVTTEERLVVGGDDSLLLPRFEITDWDGETFADQLGRIFSAG